MSTWITILLDWRLYLLITLLYIIYFYITVAFNRLPPGPLPLPLLGNLLYLRKYGTNLHLAFNEIGHTFGEVFTFYVGQRPFVVLSSYEAIRQAYVKHGDVTSNRPYLFMIDAIGLRNAGIFQNNGHSWKSARQFSTRVLRDLGMGKSVLEDKIQEEAASLVETIRSEQGQPFDPHAYFGLAVTNIICAMIYGHRYTFDDPEFTNITKKIDETFKEFQKTIIIDQHPWLRYLPGDIFSYHLVLRNWNSTKAWFFKKAEEHKLTWTDSELNDFLSHFTEEQKTSKTPGLFTNEQLIAISGDLFMAGSETTTTLLQWAMVHAIRNPACFRKVQQEIEDVVGKNRTPSWADKKTLSYTEAFINEVHRMSSIVPTGVPHECTRDIDVCGHIIPKGTLMTSNLYVVHHNPDIWANPEVFKPERFLDEEGKFVKADKLCPFGAGPRICIGEPLARMTQFLFFAALAQNFTFHTEEGKAAPSIEGTLGVTLAPSPFQLTARSRK